MNEVRQTGAVFFRFSTTREKGRIVLPVLTVAPSLEVALQYDQAARLLASPLRSFSFPRYTLENAFSPEILEEPAFSSYFGIIPPP